LRVLSNVAWGWLPGQRLDFFGLGQWDRSGHPPDGTWVDVDSDDPSDADLVWLGGRTSGRVPTGTVGELDYLLDGAWVAATRRGSTLKHRNAMEVAATWRASRRGE